MFAVEVSELAELTSGKHSPGGGTIAPANRLLGGIGLLAGQLQLFATSLIVVRQHSKRIFIRSDSDRFPLAPDDDQHIGSCLSSTVRE